MKVMSSLQKAALLLVMFSLLINIVIAQSKNTLAVKWKSLREDQKNCPDKNNCGYVELTYPVFKNESGLNAFISENVLDYLNETNKTAKNINTAFKDFADDYISTDSDSNMINAPTMSISFNISREDSKVIVIQNHQEFTGGAHPNENTEFINWDKKNDKIIQLQDILINNYIIRLTSIAKRIFLNDVKTNGNALDSYNFEDGEFALNDNFEIQTKGIYFFYNKYEIQAYVYGPTELFIPYSKIKQLLRSHSVVDQYIK